MCSDLALPPDQLPWRSGPVVRGLRLLPVRYELDPSVHRQAPPSRRDGEPFQPADAASGADSTVRSLLSALRRLMFGGK
ncbi:hypothetical protein [Streptomyces sp. TRM68367]|uniref:hypothetical protein n=1 Tax=Streptomyces sp. TRM68367 TaxID=2758415 RepID=UPI0037DD54AF